jgi:hypothetical protein
MSLTNNEAVIMFKTYFFDSCNDFRKETLIDMRHNNPKRFGRTLTQIGRMRIKLKIQFFGFFFTAATTSGLMEGCSFSALDT